MNANIEKIIKLLEHNIALGDKRVSVSHNEATTLINYIQSLHKEIERRKEIHEYECPEVRTPESCKQFVRQNDHKRRPDCSRCWDVYSKEGK